jgi:hypothetical protein
VDLLSGCCSLGSLGLRYASIPRIRVSNAIVCDFRKRIFKLELHHIELDLDHPTRDVHSHRRYLSFASGTDANENLFFPPPGWQCRFFRALRQALHRWRDYNGALAVPGPIAGAGLPVAFSPGGDAVSGLLEQNSVPAVGRTAAQRPPSVLPQLRSAATSTI